MDAYNENENSSAAAISTKAYAAMKKQVEHFDRTSGEEGRSVFFPRRKKKKSSLRNPEKQRSFSKHVSFAMDVLGEPPIAAPTGDIDTSNNETNSEEESPPPQQQPHRDKCSADGSYEFHSFSTVGHDDELCFDDLVKMKTYSKTSGSQCRERLPSEITARRKAAMGAGGDNIAIEELPACFRRAYSSSTFDFNDPNIAFVDSAANKHLLRSFNRVQRLREARISMHSSNGQKTEINHAGDLHLKTVDSEGNQLDPLVLREASIMLGGPLNLISVGILTEEGSTFHFEKGNSYFTYRGKKFKMLEEGGMFAIRLDQVLEANELSELQRVQPKCEEVEVDGHSYGCAATYDLWHQRFGHANQRRIKFLYESGSVEGLDVHGSFKHDKKCKCATCVQTNSNKVHIGNVRKYADTVTQIGQQVVCDLCGPFPDSIEGYRYVISFTDVYSRFSACYFLRRKSDAEQALEAFVAFFKKEGFVVKCIRSDQGGEFGSYRDRATNEGGTTKKTTIPVFSRVCQLHDIKHELTPAHRGEPHGLAENWNRTVVKMANAMLYSARLSHVLWP